MSALQTTTNNLTTLFEQATLFIFILVADHMQDTWTKFNNDSYSPFFLIRINSHTFKMIHLHSSLLLIAETIMIHLHELIIDIL